PVAGSVERLLSGEHLLPRDPPVAAVGLRHRRVEHAHGGAPDVGAGAVAFDERDDGMIRDDHLTALQADRLTQDRTHAFGSSGWRWTAGDRGAAGASPGTGTRR